MKIRIAALMFVGLSATASAAVYKWVDAQGNVHYGDLPPGEVPAESVKLPGISTYQQRKIPYPAAPEPAPQPAFTGYTSAQVVQPEANSAVRANDQKVTVAIALEPALQPGHKVAFYLDGRQVGEPMDSISAEFSGVYRGGHTVSAKVLDAGGKTLIEAAPVTFTLRKHTIIPPKPIPNPPPAAN